jgi:hypothetical protein
MGTPFRFFGTTPVVSVSVSARRIGRLLTSSPCPKNLCVLRVLRARPLLSSRHQPSVAVSESGTLYLRAGAVKC